MTVKELIEGLQPLDPDAEIQVVYEEETDTLSFMDIIGIQHDEGKIPLIVI